MGKIEVDEDYFDVLLAEAMGLPDYEADNPRATPDELRYTQDLYDVLQKLHESVNLILQSPDFNLEKSEELITQLVNGYVDTCKQISNKHIESIWNKATNNANEKLDSVGVDPVPEATLGGDVKGKLIAYQEKAFEKDGARLLAELIDLAYRREYWGVAYAGI